MLAQHGGTVSWHEIKYPDSVLLGAADIFAKENPLRADMNEEPIFSASKATSKGVEGTAPLLPIGVKKTFRVFQPPVKMSSSMDRGMGV